jgi:spore coat polysaccharide biosynthesis protein SpsF
MLGIVIQARMNSSRLPGKVLKDFAGKSMLLFQIDLLRQFGLNAEIVVATSQNPLDDRIETLCQQNHIQYVRGSEQDVFQRFCLVAERFQFDHMVRLTGDNPLTNYRVLKACLEEHSQTLPDLTSTRRIRPDRTLERYAPKGTSVDVINCQTLLSIDQDALNDFEKEHVIPVFYNGNYQVSLVRSIKVSGPTFSIDTREDLERASQYARNLSKRGSLLQELGFGDDDPGPV